MIGFRCIIATGLAKKPTPPPKIESEDKTHQQSKALDAPEMKAKRTGDDTASHFEPKTSQQRGLDAQIQEQTAPGRDKVKDGMRTDTFE